MKRFLLLITAFWFIALFLSFSSPIYGQTRDWDGSMDAATYYPKTNSFYIFRGLEYIRHEFSKPADNGYPRRIYKNWSGWPDKWALLFFDAIVYDDDRDVFYLFKDDEYVKHKFGQPAEQGYPRKIKGNWKGWPDSWGTGNVDAVVYDKDRKVYYLFKGTEYAKHKWNDAEVNVKPIRGNWSGWPSSWGNGGVSAVLYNSANRKYYLFNSNRKEYVRHSWGESVDSGYPETVNTVWSGYPKPPASQIDNGTYLFEHHLSGKALTSSADGRSISVQDKTGDKYQRWTVTFQQDVGHTFKVNGVENVAIKQFDKLIAQGKLIHPYSNGYYTISDRVNSVTTDANKYEALPYPCASNHSIQINANDSRVGAAFNMVISSDPQYQFSPYYEKNKDIDKSVKQQNSIRKMNEFVSSVQTLNNGLSKKISGGIINGDITMGGNSDKFNVVSNSLSGFPATLYYGLGNHDVPKKDTKDGLLWMANKVQLYSAPGMTKDFTKKKVANAYGGQSIIPVQDTYEYTGSMAYSWKEGNVRFVQLQYTPGYSVTQEFTSMETGKKTMHKFNISSSENWLGTILNNAQRNNEKVVINMHVPPLDPTVPDWFKSMMEQYGSTVIAIFSGHLHYQDCYRYDYSSAGIPVFISGAIFVNNYYLVTGYSNRLTVQKFYSTGGKANAMPEEAWEIKF